MLERSTSNLFDTSPGPVSGPIGGPSLQEERSGRRDGRLRCRAARVVGGHRLGRWLGSASWPALPFARRHLATALVLGVVVLHLLAHTSSAPLHHVDAADAPRVSVTPTRTQVFPARTPPPPAIRRTAAVVRRPVRRAHSVRAVRFTAHSRPLRGAPEPAVEASRAIAKPPPAARSTGRGSHEDDSFTREFGFER